MKKYSLEEVITDVVSFERIEIAGTSVAPNSFFSKLYSDFYELPLEGTRTVDDFKLRFNNYVTACKIISTDQEPTPGKEFSLYRYELKDGFPDKAFLIAETDNLEEILNILDRENINKAMVYIHKSKEYFYTDRQTH